MIVQHMSVVKFSTISHQSSNKNSLSALCSIHHNLLFLLTKSDKLSSSPRISISNKLKVRLFIMISPKSFKSESFVNWVQLFLK